MPKLGGTAGWPATGVRNNAGGVFNHDLYFRTLHPLPVSAPDTGAGGRCVRDFGGMAGLKEAMRKADPVLLEPIMKVVVIVPEEYMATSSATSTPAAV